MNNKYTQDMTGTGQHVELPDPGPEPERYNDWMLWKLRQSPEWNKALFGKPTFKDKLKRFLKTNGLLLVLVAQYQTLVTLNHLIFWEFL